MQTTQELRKEFENLNSIIHEMDRLDPFLCQKKADIIQLEEKLRHLNDNNNKLYTRIHELKLVEASMIRGDNNLLGNIDEQISIHNDISSNTVSINKLTHRLLFYKRNIELFIRRVNSLRDIILN